MSYDPRDQVHLIGEQYRSASNLEGRIQIYRYGSNPQSFQRWMFDRYCLPPDARVLEVGCGNGKLWLENLERVPAGWEITLADLSPGMLDEARRSLNPSGRPFDFRVMDLQAIPDADASYDAVIANHMLYHVPDLDRGLSEIRRVLKPEGKLYASTLGGNHLHELQELVSGFRPPLAVDRELAFLLETGETILKQWFEQVTIDRQSNMLAVPSAEAILIYLGSGHHREIVTGPHRDEISAQIEREIAEYGVFCVTTDAGMFTAW